MLFLVCLGSVFGFFFEFLYLFFFSSKRVSSFLACSNRGRASVRALFFLKDGFVPVLIVFRGFVFVLVGWLGLLLVL